LVNTREDGLNSSESAVVAISSEREPWQSIFVDPVLSRPPAPGNPGNVPPGGNLSLDIGWERFEQLLVFVAQGVIGLNQVRFRRYGISGQAQHGIDLAGRGPYGQFIVVQCKECQSFSAANLRDAVDKFMDGTRPFRAQHLIVAVSVIARTSQLENELAVLQGAHPDVRIDLWGAEQINDVLRDRGDIVSRFWTRETAETFCSGAPLPGVAAAPPNWTRVADQVLLSPLGVDGLEKELADADEMRSGDPAAAADMYQDLADRLALEGFTGHAHVLRLKQLDALAVAQRVDAVAALTSQLAATALHEGDMHQAQLLGSRLDSLVGEAPGQPNVGVGENAALINGELGVVQFAEVSNSNADQAKLIRAAINAVEHPLGNSNALASALRDPRTQHSGYRPLLILLLAELTSADASVAPPERVALTEISGTITSGIPSVESRLAELDDLITSALTLLGNGPLVPQDEDVRMRLRMVRASYHNEERLTLLTQARQLRLPRTYAALVLAAEARRNAIEGSADEAVEHWRQAIGHAIQDARTDDASGWLYSIRFLNVRYGPWTDRMDDEHLLAQALPKAGGGRLIRRVRDFQADARRAALDEHPIEAIRSTRRWMADSIVIGDWAEEQAAAELLGDLYAQNAEPERAANCYQWAGETKKLRALALAVGDRLLPMAAVGHGPWWQQSASLTGISAQHDLIDDDEAGMLLHALIDLVARGRAGELIDSPFQNLLLQATKTACLLAGRGSSEDAKVLLDLFARDVAREPNQYQYHDEEHVLACRAIALHHPGLVWPALERIFDLAEVGTHDALQALTGSFVLDLLRGPPADVDDPSSDAAFPVQTTLTEQQRQKLVERLQTMSASYYKAGLALFALGKADTLMSRALDARERLISRPEPDGRTFSFGTRMVSDSYLVSFLEAEDQRECLERMLTIAENRREAASNRQEALTAASNLLNDQPDDIKARVHARSRTFVHGDHDGSFLDAYTTNPHPLSTMRIKLGSEKLGPEGLHLASLSATSEAEKMWVRNHAVAFLGSSDESLVRQGVKTLSRLDAEIVGDLDATLLAGHPLPTVRQLAAVIAVTSPTKYAATIRTLATDPVSTVRVVIARRLHKAKIEEGRAPDNGRTNDELNNPSPGVVRETLLMLTQDVRHSVRRASAGLDN
jgi:hypothetical protein